MAHRFSKMLESLIIKHCGPAPHVPMQITFPRLEDDNILQSLFEEGSRTESSVRLHESLHEPGSFISLA